MKKTLLTLTVLAALSATGCTSGPDMTAATSTPQPTSTTAPTMTPTDPVPGLTEGMDMPGMESAPELPMTTTLPESMGVTSTDKARRAIEQIEEELERLSEVEEAEVVIAGNKAAVALEFDDKYRGGVDDRLRGIVKERISGVINGVSSIAITTDGALKEALEALGERVESAADMTAVQADLDAIIRKINVARS